MDSAEELNKPYKILFSNIRTLSPEDAAEYLLGYEVPYRYEIIDPNNDDPYDYNNIEPYSRSDVIKIELENAYGSDVFIEFNFALKDAVSNKDKEKLIQAYESDLKLKNEDKNLIDELEEIQNLTTVLKDELASAEKYQKSLLVIDLNESKSTGKSQITLSSLIAWADKNLKKDKNRSKHLKPVFLFEPNVTNTLFKNTQTTLYLIAQALSDALKGNPQNPYTSIMDPDNLFHKDGEINADLLTQYIYKFIYKFHSGEIKSQKDSAIAGRIRTAERSTSYSDIADLSQETIEETINKAEVCFHAPKECEQTKK